MDDLKERLFHLFQLIAPGLILQSIPNSSFHIKISKKYTKNKKP